METHTSPTSNEQSSDFNASAYLHQDDQSSNSTFTNQPTDANLSDEDLIRMLVERTKNNSELNLKQLADRFNIYSSTEGQSEINSLQEQREIAFNQYVKPLDDLIHDKELEYGLHVKTKEVPKSKREFKIYILKGNEITGTGQFRNNPDMAAYLKGTTKNSVEEVELLNAIKKQ